MDAPVYPPATAYVAPPRLAYARTTANTSIKQLLADPATKAIVEKEVPGVQGRIGNPQLKPHLDNFSPRSMVQFGMFKVDALDRIDAQIAKLDAGAGK